MDIVVSFFEYRPCRHEPACAPAWHQCVDDDGPSRVAWESFCRSFERPNWEPFPSENLEAKTGGGYHKPAALERAAYALATFGGDGQRTKANVQAVYGLVMDFDHGRTVGWATKTYRNLLAIIHTTFNHTAAKPRIRVIVPYARPVSGEEHERVWDLFAKRRKSDPQTRACNQRWYLPAVHTGNAAEYEHAVCDGDPLDVDAILRRGGPGPAKARADLRTASAPIPITQDVHGQRRIVAAITYLKSAPLSIDGQGGRATFFSVCVSLTRKMRLPHDYAEALIERYYNPRLVTARTTTWAPDEIRERLASAAATSCASPGLVVSDDFARAIVGGVH